MKASDNWGTTVNLSESTGPIVFHFRPTKYMKVAPDHLKDWEQFTLQNTGQLPDLNSLPRRNPTATISGSGEGWDDSDYW